MDFDFSTRYVLEDERVLLRPLQTEDLDHLRSFAEKEPELWTYSLVVPAGERGMAAYLKGAVAARERKEQYPFAVYDKRAGAYAGSSRFYDVDPQNKNLQLGYTWFGKAFQRTGLNRHCKYLMLEFAFEQMEMERVEFRADNENKASIAAMKAVGCIEEGVLRSNGFRPDGSRRDSIVLSILRNEWFEAVKTKLRNKLY